jgi:hypothetical protein
MIGGGLLGTRFKEERRKKAEMEGDRIRQVGRMREGERAASNMLWRDQAGLVRRQYVAGIRCLR